MNRGDMAGSWWGIHSNLSNALMIQTLLPTLRDARVQAVKYVVTVKYIVQYIGCKGAINYILSSNGVF